MNYQEIAASMLSNMTGSNTSKSKREIITVNGISEARSFNLEAGEAVALIDANEDLFYIKECDNIGKSTVRAFKYEEVELEDCSAGVSKKDFEDFKNEIRNLIGVDNGKHNLKKAAETSTTE